LFGATSVTGFAIMRQSNDALVAVASRAARTGFHGATVDAEDRPALAALIDRVRPHTVIWAHAVCDVGKCEANPEWAWMINVRGVEHLLRLLPSRTRLLYVSSDHVFGGDGIYTELADPSPISAYGRTRVAAECRVLDRPGSLVVRPGLAIGPSGDGRSGFFDWLTHRHRSGLPVTVIHDEFRSAIWADDLAKRLLALAASDAIGLRHVAGTRAVSRPELARHLLQLRRIAPRFDERSRFEQRAPHLGRVDLRSIHCDAYSAPLPAVVHALQAIAPLRGSGVRGSDRR
jgi:dTDP-4-dehydrorhamnose reductase